MTHPWKSSIRPPRIRRSCPNSSPGPPETRHSSDVGPEPPRKQSGAAASDDRQSSLRNPPPCEPSDGLRMLSSHPVRDGRLWQITLKGAGDSLSLEFRSAAVDDATDAPHHAALPCTTLCRATSCSCCRLRAQRRLRFVVSRCGTRHRVALRYRAAQRPVSCNHQLDRFHGVMRCRQLV